MDNHSRFRAAFPRLVGFDPAPRRRRLAGGAGWRVFAAISLIAAAGAAAALLLVR